MGAALAVPALLTGLGILGAGSSGAILACGVMEKCKRVEHLPGSTILTVVNGMDGAWMDENSGYAIYSGNETISNILEHGDVSMLLAPSRDPGAQLTHTFAPSNPPRRIYVTNAGAAPICVAGISIQRPNGQVVTVPGKLGAICGADHYESRVNVLPTDDGSAAECTWIDRHGSNGITLPGLAFDLSESEDQKNILAPATAEDLCRPPFMVPEDIKMNANAVQKRQRVTGQDAFDFHSRLIKSKLLTSSAVRMCEDPLTKGPDFVSLAENLYCDMSTRELHPVCEDGEGVRGKRFCFDLEQDELVEEGGDEEEENGDGRKVEKRSSVSRKGRVVNSRGGLRMGTRADKMAGKGPRKIKVVKTFAHVDVWA